MAQIKLYLANAIFSTEINEKWHNLNEKWHSLESSQNQEGFAWFGCITLFPRELAVSFAKFLEMDNVQHAAHYLSYHMCVC